MKTQTAQVVSGKPHKLFYRIDEVSKLTGLKPYVLRYWESEFAELAPEKDASNHRRYRTKDIKTVGAIRKLLYQDRYTIKGARKRLKAELRQVSPTSSVQAGDQKRAGKIAKGAQAKPADFSGKTLGKTLFQLRKEVDELLKILGAHA